MGAPPHDCVANPLGAARALFDAASRQSAEGLGHGDWGLGEQLERRLLDDGMLDRIPEINSTQLALSPPGTLVRFRGMVQDMFDMEYYVGAYMEDGIWRTTKYHDSTPSPIAMDAVTQIWDRRPLYCVPVPGESAWFRQTLASPRMDELTSQAFQSGGNSTQHSKRQREDPESAQVMEEAEMVDKLDAEQQKRQRDEGAQPLGEERHAPFTDLNLPLGASPLHPCIVKVYDCAESELKLNDVVEFVGVLSFDPQLAAEQNEGEDEMDFCNAMSALPASRVPRLHCMWMRKLSVTSPFSLGNREDKFMGGAGALREGLLGALADVLGGDNVAAECLLLHMLSRVHTRIDPVALGKLSLNLTGIGAVPAMREALAEAIALLLPRTHRIELSLQLLNGPRLAPAKDYSANRLATGVLQLAEGTHLTVDETRLEIGRLSEGGLRNMRDLRALVELQKVEYDFQFYAMDMPTDIPVLILSNLKSQLLPADLVVPVRATRVAAPLRERKEEELAAWRLYLAQARALDHAVAPAMREMLESDLVTARQEDRSLGPEAFHRWLTAARLLTASHCEVQLSPARWGAARSLLGACTARL